MECETGTGPMPHLDSLPLFPLQTVVLPGVEVPLEIFEPRYRALVADLTREGFPPAEFGIVAIRRGNEVGDGMPVMFDVGTSAFIISAEDDGTTISTVSVTRRRFRLHAVHADREPYLVGDVEWLDGDPDEEAAPPPEAVDRTSAAFEAYLDAIDARAVGLPTDPRRLTASILDALGLSRADQQAVLVAGDATDRLREVGRLCRREQGLAETLHCRAAMITPATRLSPN